MFNRVFRAENNYFLNELNASVKFLPDTSKFEHMQEIRRLRTQLESPAMKYAVFSKDKQTNFVNKIRELHDSFYDKGVRTYFLDKLTYSNFKEILQGKKPVITLNEELMMMTDDDLFESITYKSDSARNPSILEVCFRWKLAKRTNDQDRIQMFEEVLTYLLENSPHSLLISEWGIEFVNQYFSDQQEKEIQFLQSLFNKDGTLRDQRALPYLEWQISNRDFTKLSRKHVLLLTLAKYAVHGTIPTIPEHILETPDGYPNRMIQNPAESSWNEITRYNPPYYVAPSVLANDHTIKPGGWAHPEDITQVQVPENSFEGPIQFIKGYPLNPKGKTGIAGRGLLGKWGVNYATDSLVFRIHPETGKLEMLTVQKNSDGGAKHHIPGGMRENESITENQIKELKEETSLEVDMAKAKVVYEGYVGDSRNTDHAWIETTVSVYFLDEEEADFQPVAQDVKEVFKTSWNAVTPNMTPLLFKYHNYFIFKALLDLALEN